MSEDPPRRNTLRMGLPEAPASDHPRAPHPANVAKAAPLRYVLLGDAPTRRRDKPEKVVVEEEDTDDPAVLFDQLAAHLGWLPEERRPELRRFLLRGDLDRAIRRLDEEQARFPRNVSIEKCRKIVERALLRRVSRRLEPTDRVPVLTGEVTSNKPRDPRVVIADRIDGSVTIDEVLRASPLPRLASLLAFEELVDRGIVSFRARSERPPPVDPRGEDDASGYDAPVSARITRADPIEAMAHAELSRPPTTRKETPAPPPATVPGPVLDEPPPVKSAPLIEETPPPPASVAEPQPDTRPSADPIATGRPDRSRRLVAALVGTTGAAVGIAVVAIVFAARDPDPTKPAGPSASHPITQAPQGTGRTLAGSSGAPLASATAAPSDKVQVTIDATPTYARVYLDGRKLTAPYEAILPRDGKDHEVRVEAPGHKTRKVPFKSSADLSLVVALEPLPKRKPPPNPETRKDDDIY